MTAMKFARGLLSAILLSLGNAAFAQQFSGQAITMIVNFTAGGPTDIEARIVARHLPKYLQGVKSVVVRNVGGGGGVIGVNQLGESSERDRLNVGYFTWDPITQLLNDPVLHVRYNDLKFIVGFRSLTIIYARRDTPPGISRPADVVKAPIIKAGALAPSSHGTVRQRLALDLLGVKYETIAGYKGVNEMELGVRRGDLNLTNTTLPLWSASVKPNLADTGIVIPLFQYDYERPDGTLGRNPDSPDVPAFSELFKEIKGPGCGAEAASAGRRCSCSPASWTACSARCSCRRTRRQRRWRKCAGRSRNWRTTRSSSPTTKRW